MLQEGDLRVRSNGRPEGNRGDCQGAQDFSQWEHETADPLWTTAQRVLKILKTQCPQSSHQLPQLEPKDTPVALPDYLSLHFHLFKRVCVVCTTAHMWQSEHSFVALVLSFYLYVGCALGMYSKCFPHRVSHLFSPCLFISETRPC